MNFVLNVTANATNLDGGLRPTEILLPGMHARSSRACCSCCACSGIPQAECCQMRQVHGAAPKQMCLSQKSCTGAAEKAEDALRLRQLHPFP